MCEVPLGCNQLILRSVARPRLKWKDLQPKLKTDYESAALPTELRRPALPVVLPFDCIVEPKRGKAAPLSRGCPISATILPMQPDPILEARRLSEHYRDLNDDELRELA